MPGAPPGAIPPSGGEPGLRSVTAAGWLPGPSVLYQMPPMTSSAMMTATAITAGEACFD